jgi:tRNA uridine 5-carbamoylmethylation protein Kti12
MAELLLLSGPPASGNTTVARLLSERYDRVAHIDAAFMRGLRSAGRFPPWSAEPESARQRRQAARNAAHLAREFIAEVVGVVIEDVITLQSLDMYLTELRPVRARIHFVRLMPSLEACLERNTRRENERVRPTWLKTAYDALLAAGDFAGVAVDSTSQTPIQTADRLQALTPHGDSVVWTPGLAE